MIGSLRIVVLVAVLSMFGLLATTPAQACACGGFAAADGERVAASAEYAALTLGGGTERMILSMDTLTSAQDAALIIPTPQRADAALADPTLFTELAALTAPRTVVRWSWWPQLGGGLMAGAAPGSAAGGAPVTVLETKQLGDLEVASLAATDSDALAGWLDQHGYQLSDRLAAALRPYVTDGWFFTAIKLTTSADDLTGALQPLDLRFASDELVYPMRLSVAAQGSQFVRTYVFAGHRTERTDPTTDAGGMQLRFAGKIEPGAVRSPALAAIVTDAPYLTAIDQYLGRPGQQIVSDFTFAEASSDAPYRRTTYVTRTRTVLGVPAGPMLLGSGWVAVNLVVAAALVLARRRRAKQ